MRRTAATLKALQRDKFRCQTCFYLYNRIRPATDGHHIFGRGRVDEEDAIIGLCCQCHTDVHYSKIGRCELIEIMEKYVLDHDIRIKYRQFHDCP